MRSFAPLIADFYGIPGGGCITMLHRERIGDIDLSRSMGFDNLDLENTISYSELLTNLPVYNLDLVYQKPLIDGIVIDVGTESERSSGAEMLVYCGDICSLGKWTNHGIEVIRNYV